MIACTPLVRRSRMPLWGKRAAQAPAAFTTAAAWIVAVSPLSSSRASQVQPRPSTEPATKDV
jgi:hypothetical protein